MLNVKNKVSGDLISIKVDEDCFDTESAYRAIYNKYCKTCPGGFDKAFSDMEDEDDGLGGGFTIIGKDRSIFDMYFILNHNAFVVYHIGVRQELREHLNPSIPINSMMLEADRMYFPDVCFIDKKMDDAYGYFNNYCLCPLFESTIQTRTFTNNNKAKRAIMRYYEVSKTIATDFINKGGLPVITTFELSCIMKRFFLKMFYDKNKNWTEPEDDEIYND